MNRMAFVLLLLLQLGIGKADVIRVSHDLNSISSLQEAVSISSAGDTIVCSASAAAYSFDNQRLVISHPLHFIGAGWEQPGRLGTTWHFTGRPIIIHAAASGTSFEGIRFSNTPGCQTSCNDTLYSTIFLCQGASNIRISRVLYESSGHYNGSFNPSTGSYLVCLVGDNSNIEIDESCIYHGSALGSSRGTLFRHVGENSTLVVRNSLISNIYTLFNFYASVPAAVGLYNNAFWYMSNTGTPTTVTGSATNNIFYWCEAPTGDMDLQFNAGNGAEAGGNWTNLQSSPFIGLTDGPWIFGTSDIHLIPGSPCSDAGVLGQVDRDGSRIDMGVYGGLLPLIDTGEPDFPFVTSLAVPPVVAQDGVLPIFSTGRAGAGD